MKTVDVLRMNEGIGETSYANNSFFQKKVIEMAKPIREQAMIHLCRNICPATLCIADLGCSSGPNALLVASELIAMAHTAYKNLGHQGLEFQIYLNDLPMNDFNVVFRSLECFQENLREQLGSTSLRPCFVAGVPGSFYERLFPAKSLHFVHSSNCLMWRSQVPEGIGNRNGRNIYLVQSSPSNIIEAYYAQFQTDFSAFLKSRSEELIVGGHMILTFMGRESDDPTSKESEGYAWELLAEALSDMVSEGLIIEEKLMSFNAPFYTPSPIEVHMEVSKEGSFVIDQLKVSKEKWSIFKFQNPLKNAGCNFAHNWRAALEPLLSNHFGKAPMDKLFHRFSDILTDLMAREDPYFISITISLTRKS